MDNNKCMVSVLCTAYMHEQFIAQTLESILGQETDFNIEILVSDDASTDATADIIRDYAARYPDIIRPYLMEENFYSKGGDFYESYFYPQARGKYIAYCEGDDYWTDPTKLQRQVDFLEAHPDYSACVHNTTLRFCDGSAPDKLLLSYTEDTDIELETMLPGASNSFHTTALLARRDIIVQIQDFYRAAFAHGFTDHAEFLWMRLNGKIRYIDRDMSVYRIFSNRSAWSSGVDMQYVRLKRFITGELELLRLFINHVPEQYKAAVEAEILEKEFELFYIEGRDREQRKAPYDKILRAQPLKYRLINAVKCAFPRLHRLYRRYRGYTE